MPVAIAIDQDAVADFCRRHHITELALFGSVLRDDFTPDSDVDEDIVWETATRDIPPLICALEPLLGR